MILVRRIYRNAILCQSSRFYAPLIRPLEFSTVLAEKNTTSIAINDNRNMNESPIISEWDITQRNVHLIDLVKTLHQIPQQAKEIIDHAALDSEYYSADIKAATEYPGIFVRQLRIEEEQQNEAVKRYQEMLKELMKMGRATGLKQMQKLLLKWYEPLCEAISAEIKLVLQKVPGLNRGEYGPCLMMLPAEKLAVITLDTSLTAILRSGNAGATVTPIAFKIGSLIENEVTLMKLKFGVRNLQPWDQLLVKNAVNDKKYALSIQYKLRKLIEDEEWPVKTRVRVGALLMSLLVNVAKTETHDRAFYHTAEYNFKLGKKFGILKLDGGLYKDIASKDITQVLPRHLPMLVEPRDWDLKKKNYGGCYYRLRTELMRTLSKLHVDTLRRANMKPVLDGLNYLGKLPWKMNKKMLGVVQEAWKRKMVVAELPPQEDVPLPRQEDCMKIVDNQVIFDEKLYKDMEKRIKKRNSELHSLRCDFKLKLTIAEKFQDDILFFPWNLDFRGRAYPIPANLSHLGSDLCRGILLFNNTKPLGNDGLKWLKVHLANLHGNNKISLDDREAWTNEHMAKVIDSAKNPLDGSQWWVQADEPFQALATCMEIVQAIESGDPTTYECSLPVHQDGSCNGLQHYAALGRDELGGRAVNLVPSEVPQDVYSKVLEIVLRKIEHDCTLPAEVTTENVGAKEGEAKTFVKVNKEAKYAKFVRGHVNRKVIKQTVMTSVYGVTRVGARDQVQARLQEIFMADPSAISTSELEKEVAAAAAYVSGLALESLTEMFMSAQHTMGWLAHAASLVAKQGQVMSWITPLGLPVMQPYRKTATYQISSALQNITLTLNSDALPVSPQKQKSAFSPNFVHSLDASHMLMTALKMKERGLAYTAVHDSYWTHACDVPVLSKVRHPPSYYYLLHCFV